MIEKVRQLIVTLLILVGVGCGGGTRGSGGQLYDGFIGDESAKGLPGISVTIIQSGDSAVSDRDGRFTIKTGILSGKLSLLIEGATISTQVETEDIPAEATRITLSITVPSTNQSASSVTIGIVERRPQRVPGTKTPEPSDDDSHSPDEDSPSDDGAEDDDADSDDDDSDSGSSGSDDDRGDSDGNDDSGNDDSGDGGSDDNGDSGSDSPQDGEKRDITGAISSISSSSVTLSGFEFFVTDRSEFKDSDGKESKLSDFKVGTAARARGVYRSGKLLLERLEAR